MRNNQQKSGAVHTGSTLLNLACTESPEVGYLPGTYYYLVGDSSSGKTWFSKTCFAEACLNKAFSKHRLIFDDVENGSLMDVKHFFGKSVYDRTEPPKGTRAKPVFSETVEDFYYNITDALKKGVPFIYVLDSQDSLDSAAARKKFNEQKKASESEKDSAGSYGDGKAKYHSENIRRVITGLRKTGSILIIIGQTRDNLGFGFQKKTRSGGKSLRFYAHVEMWTSVEKTLKKRVRKKDRTIGNRVLVEVKKNRVSGKIGKDRAVRIPILVGHGIDDVGSCVDYLIEEEHWKKSKGQDGKTKYLASEFDVRGGRDQLVRYVEENDLEKQLAQVVADVWMEIEDACAPKRKMKYNKQHGTSQD